MVTLCRTLLLLRCTLHRLIFAGISRWMTFDPAELPLLPGGKYCALALLNIIPKFSKEKHQFLSALSSKSSISMCSICMISKAYKMFFENFVSQKMAYVTNRLQKDERWQRLLLGDWLRWYDCSHRRSYVFLMYGPKGRTLNFNNNAAWCKAVQSQVSIYWNIQIKCTMNMKIWRFYWTLHTQRYWFTLKKVKKNVWARAHGPLW